MWQCRQFNQVPAQCLIQTVTLPECVALGHQRRADDKGCNKFPPVVCSNQADSDFLTLQIRFWWCNRVFNSIFGQQLGTGMWKVIPWAGEGEPYLWLFLNRNGVAPGGASDLWSSDGQLVLPGWYFRGVWIDLLWSCGPKAAVFAGLKPIFLLDFSLKEI